jgi:hypothetical protein
MKLLATFILNVFTFAVYSQHAEKIDIPSNSFENEYRISNPTLKYSYDEISQIHNYSNNWDFDNDGIKDQIYFVGTGGAHIYYFLRVIFSSDKKVRDLNFIQSDFPLLTDTLNIEKTSVGFAINNLEKELTPTIIIRLDDNTYDAFKNELVKQKIEAKNCSISFKNGKIEFGCF